MIQSVSMKQLLEAGVHFGHRKQRWNPKMDKYIYTDRNDIHIVDLKKTLKMLREACVFVRDTVAEGGRGIFVGTKKQAREAVVHWAEQCNMFYINNRWLGGILTNWQTMKTNVKRLIDLEKMIETGEIEKYSKKEQSQLNRERERLKKNLEGVKAMKKLPSFIFVIDPHKEQIAVREANKLKIPVVAIVDTNCDPNPIDHIIPGNDDAIRAINLVSQKMAESCIAGILMRVEAGLESPSALPEVVRQQVMGITPETPATPEAAISSPVVLPVPTPVPMPATSPPAESGPGPQAKTESPPALEGGTEHRD